MLGFWTLSKMTDNSIESERIIFELVEKALSIPAEKRQAFVDSIIGEEARERVLGILSKIDESSAAIPTGAGPKNLLSLDQAPTTIGNFKVLGELGRGGMGVVYLGRRSSDDFDQLVAIKVLRQVKSTDEGFDRFRDEVKVLSSLRHPSIAQVFDAGETEGGLPYFVMEYVEGERLLDFVERSRLSVSDILKLFLDLCEIVAFAHRRLIVHRDLSPANVLITAEGHLKLIDFGVSFDLVGSERRTESDAITLGYSAPECADPKSVTVMTDVYSLGRILEFLVKSSSFKLPADLAVIIFKATNEIAAERYVSVDALMDDIRRFQDSRPVLASAKGWRYRAKKYCQRHYLSLISTAAALIVTTALSVIFYSLYVDAEQSRSEASARFQEVRALGNFMVQDLFDEIAELPGSLPAKRKLIEEALRYLDSLESLPDSPDDLKVEVARGYIKLANILGDPSDESVGEISDSRSMLEKARALLDTLPASANSSEVQVATARLFMAQSRQAALVDYDFLTGVKLVNSAIANFENLKQEGKLSEDDLMGLGNAYALAGYYHFYVEEYDDALDRLNIARLNFSEAKALAQNPRIAMLNLARNNILVGEVRAWQAYEEGGDYSNSFAAFELGLSQLNQLDETNQFSAKQRRIWINALHKYASSACEVESHQRKGLQALDTADSILAELNALTPQDATLAHYQQLSTSYRFSCHHQMGNLIEAIKVGENAVSQLESLISERGEQPNFIDFYSQVTTLLAEVYAIEGNSDEACLNWEKSLQFKNAVEGVAKPRNEITHCPYK